MTDTVLAPVHVWLAAALDPDVSEAITRLRRAPDVRHIAVMPDVHLSSEVCVGVVLATANSLYPQAVGGDIGCGMLAVGFDMDASAVCSPDVAARILEGLRAAAPSRRRNRRDAIPQPRDVANQPLSHPQLESIRRNQGVIEFATLGSGNHFIELQADEENRLWLMLHSGSRAMGQAIRDHHLARAQPAGNSLRVLDALSPEGVAYRHDAAWARLYASASRNAMAHEAGRVIAEATGAMICWDTAIHTDHNHVAREHHNGNEFWVHRKGAMPASQGQDGVLPGSMGTLSFHVEGRGNPQALCSSAHGAGRALSRTAARIHITARDFHREMSGIWYDARLAPSLRDEAPSAYKDVRSVLRAQRDLVKVQRTLRPVLNYKGM